jgi:hypothetical protein
MPSDEMLERVRQQFEEAKRKHEAALHEAMAAFERLTPREQMDEQLRKWQALLTGDIR